MTPDWSDVTSVREWAAVEVMGWKVYGKYLKHYMGGPAVSDWRPDQDFNQLQQCVVVVCGEDHTKRAQFAYGLEKLVRPQDRRDETVYLSLAVWAMVSNPLAVLRALWEVKEAKNGS